uniref:Uncharacterized protein n=1 Tax=Rhizophora mucronata TaxID=61149 RepID=A0A2P2NJD2_RHIMU
MVNLMFDSRDYSSKIILSALTLFVHFHYGSNHCECFQYTMSLIFLLSFFKPSYAISSSLVVSGYWQWLVR